MSHQRKPDDAEQKAERELRQRQRRMDELRLDGRIEYFMREFVPVSFQGAAYREMIGIVRQIFTEAQEPLLRQLGINYDACFAFGSYIVQWPTLPGDGADRPGDGTTPPKS